MAHWEPRPRFIHTLLLTRSTLPLLLLELLLQQQVRPRPLLPSRMGLITEGTQCTRPLINTARIS